jgi:TetR/AcrR family transcriptional repressor of nem operon
MNKKHNKEKVLNIGMNLFWKKGYKSVGINEICNVTEMTKGAFYNKFKGKEQFLNETIELYGEINSQLIHEYFQAHDKLSNFDKLLKFYSDLFLRQPTINFIGCFMNNIMLEMGILNKHIGKVSSKVYDNFINDIEPIVKKAQEENEITDTIDSKNITELLQSSFYGALTRVQSSKNYEHGIRLIQILLNNLKPNNHKPRLKKS